MKKILLIIISIATFIDANSLNNIIDFSYDGIKLGSTLKKVKQKYNVEESALSTEQADSGIMVIVIENMRGASKAFFYFYQDTLYLTVINYDTDDLDRMGGIEIFMKKLQGKIGAETKIDSEPGENYLVFLEWDYKEKIERQIELILTKESILSLRNRDWRFEKKIRQKRSINADFGF